MNTLLGLLNSVGIEDPTLCPSLTVSSICYNSKQCTEKSVFFAFSGLHTDGDLYIEEAIQNGAICIVSRHPVQAKQESVFYYTTEAPRPLFSRMCAAFHDWPAKSLVVIGVTGTDGKSTTSDYLYQMLRSQGCKVGILGTVSMDDGSGKQASPYRQSTPEADQMHRFLRRCVENSLTHVVLECTSHALSREYDRLATIEFSMALVPTVSSEHLEFHKTIQAYVDAKCNLVRALRKGGTFLTTQQNPYRTAFIRALPPSCSSYLVEEELPYSLSTTEEGFSVIHSCGLTFETPLQLSCLASNAMLALLAASRLLGKKPHYLLPLLEELTPVAGRMVTIKNRLGIRIVIDFAHTADAYAQIFSHMREGTGKGNIIAVFGCAGERDTSKRAPMGKIASHYSDRLILTEEDPRGEESKTIFRDLRSEMDNPSCIVEEIEDREAAIERAFTLAKPGDTLLFLGKGHESSIEGRTGKRSWNEEAVVLSMVQKQERATGCV